MTTAYIALIAVLLAGAVILVYRKRQQPAPRSQALRAYAANPLAAKGDLTPKDIQDKADLVLQPLIDSIVTFQEDWIKSHKGYWQGIRTPSDTPKDGVDTAPEKDVKPVGDTDAKAWKDVAIQIPAALPCSVEVFTHDGPKGKGYTIVSRIAVGSQFFAKVSAFGQESMTGSAWVEVIESKDGLNG